MFTPFTLGMTLAQRTTRIAHRPVVIKRLIGPVADLPKTVQQPLAQRFVPFGILAGQNRLLIVNRSNPLHRRHHDRQTARCHIAAFACGLATDDAFDLRLPCLQSHRLHSHIPDAARRHRQKNALRNHDRLIRRSRSGEGHLPLRRNRLSSLQSLLLCVLFQRQTGRRLCKRLLFLLFQLLIQQLQLFCQDAKAIPMSDASSAGIPVSSS